MNKYLALQKDVFDINKVTVVGSPTITSDGVASVTPSRDALHFYNFSEVASTHDWDLYLPFTVTQDLINRTNNTWLYRIDDICLGQWYISNVFSIYLRQIIEENTEVLSLNLGVFNAKVNDKVIIHIKHSVSAKTIFAELIVNGSSANSLSKNYTGTLSWKNTEIVTNTSSTWSLPEGSIEYDLPSFKTYVDGQLVYSPTKPTYLLERRNKNYCMLRTQAHIILDYLESDGNQWIDTGFLSKQLYDKSLYIKMKTTGGTSSYAYNGAYHTSGTGLTIQFGLLATSDTLCRTTLNHFDPSYLNVTDLQKSKYTELMMTPTEYWVNGELKANHEQTSIDKILETNNKFLLFGRSQYNQSNSITPMIISEFWIKDANGKFVQHLIPVLDKNFVPRIYDSVTRQYLPNQGTGQFSYNLFDADNAKYVAGYISTNNNGTISASTLTDTFYIPCQPNTTYKIERTAYAQANQVWRAATSSVEPYVEMKINNFVGGLINDLSLTITTGSTDKYLLFSEGYTKNTNDLNKFRITIVEK